MGYQPKRCRRKRRRTAGLRLPAAVLLLVLVLAGSWSGLSNHVDARHDTDDLPRQKLERQAAAVETPVPVETIPAAVAPQPEESAPVAETETARGYDYSVPVPQGEAVDNNWFSDAAFLGDSLTDGLLLYSDIRGAANLSYKGLTVQSVRTDKVIRLDGQKYTPLEALGQKTYGKVYILLGINELGYPAASFRSGLSKLLQRVNEIQPNAVIYLQTLPPVNEEVAQKNKLDPSLNNTNAATFNQIIKELAAQYKVALIDTASVYRDQNGSLPADLASDGVHFVPSAYRRWVDYMASHTLSFQSFDASRK